MVFQDVHPFYVKPVSVRTTEGNRQPVGQINHTFILDSSAGNVSDEAVETTGGVGPGIVHTISARLCGCTSRGEVPVPQRAKGLAQAFLCRVVPVESQGPDTRRDLCFTQYRQIVKEVRNFFGVP